MTTDEQQPQPGPKPTPTPRPVVALQIVSITPHSGGTGELHFPSPLDSLLVSKDYMDTCKPESGGFFCRTSSVKFFMTDADYSEQFS